MENQPKIVLIIALVVTIMMIPITVKLCYSAIYEVKNLDTKYDLDAYYRSLAAGYEGGGAPQLPAEQSGEEQRRAAQLKAKSQIEATQTSQMIQLGGVLVLAALASTAWKDHKVLQKQNDHEPD